MHPAYQKMIGMGEDAIMDVRDDLAGWFTLTHAFSDRYPFSMPNGRLVCTRRPMFILN